MRALLVVVTAFTVAHSITLIASAYNVAPDALWFPPLVETLIAASIFYMAIENIIGANIERRWVMTFAFGLVHGFGFSFLLRERLQFAGSHLLSSLLAFNVGVEFGQLLVLMVLIPALGFLFTQGGPGADGRDPPVGGRRAHGVALDDRALGKPQPLPAAGPGRRRRCQPDALGDGRHRHGDVPVVDVGRGPPLGRAAGRTAPRRRALTESMADRTRTFTWDDPLAMAAPFRAVGPRTDAAGDCRRAGARRPWRG